MSLHPTLLELADFDTALIANTVGYIDPTPVHEWYMGGSIQSMTPTVGPTVGVAMTLEIDSSTPHNRSEPENYYEILKLIQANPEPVVLVIKAVGSRPDHECVLGDGMAKMLHSVGCVGVVTDGGVRDIEGILTVPFGLYAKQRTIHHTNVRYTAHSRPVEVGGITITPGDIIHANIGGVMKIPPSCLPKLASASIQMRAFEHEAHLVFRRTDLSIDEKRKAVDALVAKLGR